MITSIFSIFCDKKGIILKVIKNDFESNNFISIGKNFTTLFNNDNIKKAEFFFNTIRFQQFSLNFQFNIEIDTILTTLNFSGILIEEQILIIASNNFTNLDSFHKELVNINNEQVNIFRATLKDQLLSFKKNKENEYSIYEEISKLNNELANTQRELAKKNFELENLNKLKDTFLGMAAHDLRSPLWAIMSFSEFLLDDTADILDAEHLEFISIIHTSSNFMLSLINDLLDISKIESGKLELDLKKTDLTLVIKNNIRINQILAEKKNIKINFIQENELPEVFFDKDKIEQVLNNLISNAVKFSMKNTIIEVSVKSDYKEVIVMVKDQGQGIPENEISKLFKAFQKTSVKTTNGEQSTGLGLLIVKKIIERHNGKIWVESTVGIGSKFIFSLPLI